MASFRRTARGWRGRGRRLSVCCVPRDSTRMKVALFGLAILISIDRVVSVVSLVRRFEKSSHGQIKVHPAGHRDASLAFFSTTFSHSSAASVCSLYPSTVQPCPRRSRDLLGLFCLLFVSLFSLPPCDTTPFFLLLPTNPSPALEGHNILLQLHSLSFDVSKKPSFPYPNRPPQPAAHLPY